MQKGPRASSGRAANRQEGAQRPPSARAGAEQYWRTTRRLTAGLLLVWAAVALFVTDGLLTTRRRR